MLRKFNIVHLNINLLIKNLQKKTKQNNVNFYLVFRFLKIVNMILFSDILNKDYWLNNNNNNNNKKQ